MSEHGRNYPKSYVGNWSLGVVRLVPFSVLDYVRTRVMQHFLPDNNLFQLFLLIMSLCTVFNVSEISSVAETIVHH